MVKASSQKAASANGMNDGEEDYRVKNAREGREIYVPGRSVEEVKAELNKRPVIELSEVPGGFCMANTRTGSSRYVSDETGKPLDPADTSPKETREAMASVLAWRVGRRSS
jgi:hypothetical protein